MARRKKTTLKQFLENRAKTIAVSNKRAALFASAMNKSIKGDVYSELAFWNICHDVFGDNPISEKLCAECWQAFDFKRSLEEAGVSNV